MLFVPHMGDVSGFHGWGRCQLSKYIIVQNIYCIGKASGGVLHALSRQDISSFGPQALLLLHSALGLLGPSHIGTSGSFLLMPVFITPWYMTQSISLKWGF